MKVLFMYEKNVSRDLVIIAIQSVLTLCLSVVNIKNMTRPCVPTTNILLSPEGWRIN